MAEITILECDVFKTRYNVEKYTLKLIHGTDEGMVSVWAHKKCLSPRGLKRLERFVEKGLSQPGIGEPETPREGGNDADKRREALLPLDEEEPVPADEEAEEGGTE